MEPGKSSVRPFDFRDFGLLRRVGDQGVCLDTEIALTRGAHTLQTALLSYLAPGASTPTFVLPADGEDGHAGAFGQVRHHSGSENARITYVAPVDALTGSVGYALIERLGVAAGERGAHNLLAEVGDGTDEFETLRALGFSVYARQELWQLKGEARDLGGAAPLRLQESVDGFGIRTLYANIVPRLVQQFEPPPARRSRGYVCVSEGEALTYLDVARGPLGILIHPYFHPAAQDVPRMLSLFARTLPDRRGRPLYFVVRSYLNWHHHALEEVGFEQFAEQAVLVKRLVVRAAQLAHLSPVAVLEGRARVTSPVVKRDPSGPQREAPTSDEGLAQGTHGGSLRNNGSASGKTAPRGI